MLADLAFRDIIIVLASLLVSLGVHEAMHAYVAHQLGDTTAADEGRLSLNPLKHVDLYTTILLPAVLMLLHLPPIFIAKPVPFDPMMVRFGDYGAALVALAGPFSNLGLATAAAVVVRTGFFSFDINYILALFIMVNIALFVFNMLPIPPLDGSRLLYALAPEPVRGVMRQIESMGIFLIVALLLVLSPFLSPILSTINSAIYQFLL